MGYRCRPGLSLTWVLSLAVLCWAVLVPDVRATLNFTTRDFVAYAINLECLEAQFYSCAVTGMLDGHLFPLSPIGKVSLCSYNKTEILRFLNTSSYAESAMQEDHCLYLLLVILLALKAVIKPPSKGILPWPSVVLHETKFTIYNTGGTTLERQSQLPVH